jgi:hypothetical protein
MKPPDDPALRDAVRLRKSPPNRESVTDGRNRRSAIARNNDWPYFI